MSLQIIIALGIALGGFGSAWQIQSWRADAEGKQRAETALENERLVAKTRSRNDNAVIAATNAGVTRNISLRRDADSSRAALVGLSHAADAVLRDAATSHETCVERANTLGELFLTSSKEYTGMAEKAGRHANDVQTLVAAWPTNKEK